MAVAQRLSQGERLVGIDLGNSMLYLVAGPAVEGSVTAGEPTIGLGSTRPSRARIRSGGGAHGSVCMSDDSRQTS